MEKLLIFENISMAFQAIKANKMRSFLTMLGIIIGIAAVIAIRTVGDTLTKSISSSFESFGANNVTIGVVQKSTEETRGMSGFSFRGYRNQKEPKKEDYLTDEMLQAFWEKYPDEINGYSISLGLGQGTISRNGDSVTVNAQGVNEKSLASDDLEILAGAEFGSKAQKAGKGVCVVSDYLVEKLFGDDNEAAIGQKIELVIGKKFYSYTITGVYKYESNGMLMGGNSDPTTYFYVPLKSAQNHLRQYGYKTVTAIKNTDSDTDVYVLMKLMENFFARYYRKNKEFEVSTSSMSTMMDQLTSTMSTMSMAISVIAGISLLVGGVGVMNIMLVSISERTREIGTRKALGATNGSIKMQFIIEAAVLCVIGGIIGTIIGIIGGNVAGTKVLTMMELDPNVAVSVSSIVLAVGFSLAIGIFFGYYPANKAAQMNPIDALRYE